MELSIGEFAILQNLLGNVLPNLNAQVTTEFGSWYLFSYSALIVVITVLVAIASKMKFNDFLSNAWEGIKKVGKPIAFLVFAYMVFVFLYWSPIMPTVINELSKLTSSFNPFVATIQAFLAGFFNSDLAYVGFSLTYYLSNFAGTEGNIIYIIFTSIYGLVQFITPISVFLLFGLSYMDIPYKKWMGYIWKFFVGMLVCLLVIFALLTGMRKGEILGLQWKDIDFNKNIININKQLSRVKNYNENIKSKTILKIIYNTKTDNSTRAIPITNDIKKLLEKHRIEQNKNKDILKDRYIDNDMVFCKVDGIFLDPDTTRDKYCKLAEEANVKKCTFHALRHTFATRALESGMNVKVLSKILGHYSVQFTLDTYAHALIEMKTEEMEKMSSYMQLAIS